MRLVKKIILALLVLPFLLLIGWSVSSSWTWPNLLPDSFSFRSINYIVSESANTIELLLTSMALSSIVTVLTLLVSIPAARALAFYEFSGKQFIQMLILLPLVVPMMSVSIGIHLTFIKLNLANSTLGVILIHIIPGIPYAVRFIYHAYCLNGEKMEFQAKVLGASSFKVFKYITLPLITPSLIVAGSLVYVLSFTQYFLTFLIGGGRVITIAMSLFPFVEAGDRQMASVLSLIFVISIIFVQLIANKLVKYTNTLES